MKITKSTIEFTANEKDILRKAYDILNDIAEKMDRATQVDYTIYTDEEIWDACDIIKSFL